MRSKTIKKSQVYNPCHENMNILERKYKTGQRESLKV